MSREPMIAPLANARFVLGVALAVAATLGTRWGQTASTPPEMLWYWVRHCRDAKVIRVEVLLDGKSIYRSSFCIGRMRPAEVEAWQIGLGQTVAFTFKGGHLFQGEWRTVPAQTIKGEIWQAGGEPDGLLLGVSFSTKDRLLLNSLHFVKPDGNSESKLDPGLFIRTYPVPRSAALHAPFP
jgi:hypothetical protein